MAALRGFATVRHQPPFDDRDALGAAVRGMVTRSLDQTQLLHRKATVKCRWLPARWFETCAWVATADSATHRSRYSALTPGLSFLAAGGGGDVRASFPGDRLRLGG